MDRFETMGIIACARGDAAAFTRPGTNSGLLYEKADAPATIYNMDMGYATPMALGTALARPDRKVLSIEGDGSFFAGSVVLSTIWRMRPENLVVVVLDNEVWGTGDGTEPTATGSGSDIAGLARANGWTAANVHVPARPQRARRPHGGGDGGRRPPSRGVQDRHEPRHAVLAQAADPQAPPARLRGADACGTER